MALFAFPKQAEFGRVVPKNKIYVKGRVSRTLREKFVKQIAKIVWKYKLSPETVNLPSTRNVPEIEVFAVSLREAALSADLLRSIDNAIPFPTIYELEFGDKVRMTAAFKRPSEADSAKWVTDIYFESDWAEMTDERAVLPVSLDLGHLYEQIIRSLIPTRGRDDESLRGTTARIADVRRLEREAAIIESRMRKERQFNRRVELNAELRKLRYAIKELSQ